MQNFIVFITFVTYCNIADFSFDIINGKVLEVYIKYIWIIILSGEINYRWKSENSL